MSASSTRGCHLFLSSYFSFFSSLPPLHSSSLLSSSHPPLPLFLIDVFAPRSNKHLINSRGDQIRSQQDDGSGNHLLGPAGSATPRLGTLRMMARWNDELSVPHRGSTVQSVRAGETSGLGIRPPLFGGFIAWQKCIILNLQLSSTFLISLW